MITTVIPIGPFEANFRWFDECVKSVRTQLGPRDNILIIDDHTKHPLEQYRSLTTDVYRNPWRLGIAASFNIGVALAQHNLVVMLGSDDYLLPNALEACKRTYTHHKDDTAYYWMPIVYSDGEEQALPCHAAMVTKGLWNHTGGFAPETSIGAPDAALISILMGNGPNAGRLYKVGHTPLYWVRRHNEQDTATRLEYQNCILHIRNILTRDWKPQ